MKKNEFLIKLSAKLDKLSNEDRKDIIKYYSELIEDKKEMGYREEKVIEELGDVNLIAKRLLIDYNLKSDEYTYVDYSNSNSKKERNESRKERETIRKEKEYDKYERKQNKSSAKAILLIVTFPIWFTLIIFFATLVLAFAICLVSIVISFVAVGFSGIAVAIVGIIRIGLDGPAALLGIAAGLLLLGLSLILTPIIAKFFKFLIKISAKCLGYIGHAFKEAF